ncbi:MAG: hypothetical protein WDN75_11010 [Bacteroidota bacterium]
MGAIKSSKPEYVPLEEADWAAEAIDLTDVLQKHCRALAGLLLLLKISLK